MHKKTLCLGGSFNPIHHGHLICARAVAESKGFERVLLIPSRNPPHKPDLPDLAASEHRLAMCRLAIDDHAGFEPTDAVQFEVSDIELRRSGPSYTIDTICELRKSGWPRIDWLIGADMLNYLPNWHKVADLLNEATFLVVARPGVPIDWNALPSDIAKLKNNLVEAPLIQISSSAIRQRIRAGLSISYLTASSVCEYIRANQLYRST